MVFTQGLEAHASLVVIRSFPPFAIARLPSSRDRVLAPHNACFRAFRHSYGIIRKETTSDTSPTKSRPANHLKRELVEAVLVEAAIGWTKAIRVAAAMICLDCPCDFVGLTDGPFDASPSLQCLPC